MMDRRVVADAMIPSLRIVRGGVMLPNNVVDVNARQQSVSLAAAAGSDGDKTAPLIAARINGADSRI